MKSDQESWGQDELHKLDAWIAENLFRLELERDGDYVHLKHADTEGDIPRYSSRPEAFALVKREIERWGWDWNCSARLRNGQMWYWFTIYEAAAMEHYTHHKAIGFSQRTTEELAGCLAILMALEEPMIDVSNADP